MAEPEMTLTIDSSRLQSAIEQYLTQRLHHSVAFVINRKLFHIAKRAYDGTPVAKRHRILETFNVTQRERTVKKGRFAGRVRRVTNYSGLNKSAFAIMNWRRRKKGLPTLQGKDALKATKAMVAYRLRAVGSLKSGWVGAIAKLQRRLAESFFPEIQTRVNRPGSAEPAREESNPVGEIVYKLAINKKGQEQIDPRVVSALQKAFDDEADDTLAFLASELQKDADKINAP